MTIVLTCNRKWYQYINTLIYSINENNSSKIYLIIEDDKLPYGVAENVKIININDLKEYITKDSPNYNTHYTKMTFVRCYLSKILKEDKIIYLDADTIVNKSLLDLWNTDIENYALAGVKEYGEWFDYIGVPNDKYINVGVLLMNLKYIRENKLDDKIIKLLNERLFAFPDQDTINIVCENKIKYINPIYNSQILTLITSNAVVFHYIRKQKGWLRDSFRSEYWFRYRDKMLKEKLKGGYKMVRAEVIERFNFARFNELKNIVRKNANTQEGLLEVGDTFDCSKEIADYLLGENGLKRAFIEVIEVIPEEKAEIKEEPKEEKPVKKVAKKTTKKAKK